MPNSHSRNICKAVQKDYLVLKSISHRPIEIPKVSSQSLNPFPLDLLNQLTDLLRNNQAVEAKILICSTTGQGLSKGAHRDPRVGVALPAVDGVRLDDDDGRAALQPEDCGAVFLRLLLEEPLAREADDARFDAVLFLEKVLRCNGEDHLGAGAEKGYVCVGFLHEDIGALLHAFAAGVRGILGEILAGEGDEGRCGGCVDGGDEGAGDFFGVAGPHVEEVGHGAVEGGQRDGLVGRAVFAGADAVVGSDVDLLEALEGAHADGGRGVEVKHEEGGGYGEEGAAVEGDEAVGDGCHGVFSDSVPFVSDCGFKGEFV